MSPIKYIPLGIFATLTFGTVSAYAVGLSTSWENTTLSQDECIKRAEVAMRNSGFSNLKIGSESIFADRKEYSGSIRCITSKKIIFFVVAGPSSDTAGDLRKTILDNF